MASDKQIEIVFKGDPRDLNKALKKIGDTGEKQTKRVKKNALAMGQALKKSAKVGAVAAAALGAGLFALTKKTAEAMDATLAFSNSTGIAVDTLSRMSHVAEINKTSSEVIQNSMFKLIKSMGDADAGGKRQIDTFNKLGLTIHDQNGELKNAEKFYFETVEALGKLTNKTERTTLASDLFGKTTKELGSLLDNTQEELQATADEADKLGVSFDREAAEKAAKFNDALGRLGARIKGVAQDVTTKLAPSLADAFDNTIGPAISRVAERMADFFEDLSNSGNLYAKLGIDAKEVTKGLDEFGKVALNGSEKLTEFAKAIAEAEKNDLDTVFFDAGDGLGVFNGRIEDAVELWKVASKISSELNSTYTEGITGVNALEIEYEGLASKAAVAAEETRKLANEQVRVKNNSSRTPVKKEKQEKTIANKRVEEERKATGKIIDMRDVLWKKDEERTRAAYDEMDRLATAKFEKEKAEQEIFYSNSRSLIQNNVTDPLAMAFADSLVNGKSFFDELGNYGKQILTQTLFTGLSGIFSGVIGSAITGNPFSLIGSLGSAFGFASGGPVGDKGLVRVNDNETVQDKQTNSDMKQLVTLLKGNLGGSGGNTSNTFNIAANDTNAIVNEVLRVITSANRRNTPLRAREVYA